MSERAGGEVSALGRAHSQDHGYPALMLHGQPGSARDWDAVVAAIGGRVPAIAVDRPGWDGRRPPGDVKRNADAAIAALDDRGIERAVIVGHSFGGAVAAWLAAEHPERVAGLILVSPAANHESVELIDRFLALPVVGYLTSGAILASVSFALSLPQLRTRLSSAFALPDDYLRGAARRWRGRPARRAFWVEQRALLRDLPVLEERLERIAAPTTIVVGARDAIVPVAAGRRLAAQIAGAELVEIEGGHHALTAEHPHRLAELIVAAARPDTGAGARALAG